MSTTIESLEVKIQANSTSATKGIDALTQSLNKLKSATKGGVGLSGVADEMDDVSDSSKKASSSLESTSKSSDKSSKSFTDLFHKAKLVVQGLTQTIQTIGKAIKKSNDYIENVNLFKVAMGESADAAMDYANSVSEVIGIDTSAWIKNQGIFQTLATGFGVASDRATTMSQNLTQLGYDISSFYNTDVNDAMQKLQSGLSGELEPLRRLGYDLSQAKLEATAAELGIEKSVSSMTQAEKAQLRYYAILTQVTTAHGDMARTIEDPANQIRVLKAQIEMTARSIGNIFIPALKSILPYGIAVTKVIREAADAIASFVGYEAPEIDTSGASAMSSIAETTSEEMENATESAKKLKSYMLGFDELNVINPNTESTAEDSSGLFDFALPEYDFLGKASTTKVDGIVNKFKEVLGELKDFVNSIGFDDLIDRVKTLFNTIKGQFEGLDFKTPLVEAVGNWIGGMVDRANLLLQVLTPILEALNIPQLMLDGLELYAEWLETLRDVVKALTPALTALIKPLTPIFQWIGEASSGSMNFITDTVSDVGDLFDRLAPTLERVGGALGNLIAKVWDFLLPVTNGVWEGFHDALSAINNVIFSLIECVVTLADSILGGLNGAFDDLSTSLSPLRDLIGNVLSTLFDRFSTVLNYLASTVLPAVASILSNLFNNVIIPIIKLLASKLKPIFEIISVLFSSMSSMDNGSGSILAGAFEEVCAIINNVVIPVLSMAISAFQFLWDYIFAPIANFMVMVLTPVIKGVFGVLGMLLQGLSNMVSWLSNFDNVTQLIGDVFVSLWEGVKSVWSGVSTWFDEEVIQPVVNVFSPIVKWISSFFEGCWLIVRAVWVVAADFFYNTFIAPVKANFEWVCERIGTFFTELWDDVKAIWDWASGWFSEHVLDPIKANFDWVCGKIGEFFTGLWGTITTKWDSLCKWFKDHVTDPVKNLFDSVCNAISGFFDWLWKGIRIGAISTMNGVIGAIEGGINLIISMFNALIGGFSKVVEWAADILGEDWGGLSLIKEVKFDRIPLPEYANGAYDIPSGQLFVAREAGAEMVGSIGRKTAVANNDQIVGGIASGVAEANGEQNALLREQNSLLRAILEKDSGVYLDGKPLTESVEKYQRQRGRVLVTGGVI